MDNSDEELKPVELDTEEGSLTRQLVRRLTSSEVDAPTQGASTGGSTAAVSSSGKLR